MVPIDLLKKIQFLADLSDEIIKKIILLAQVETFDPDTILVRQNQFQHLVYMVAAGKICLNAMISMLFGNEKVKPKAGILYPIAHKPLRSPLISPPPVCPQIRHQN